jgi:lambda family phage portal protein
MSLKAAAGVGVPYMNMTGDLRAANYGSQRGGLISFRRKISMLQNGVMIFQFCRPIKDRWLQAGILGGSFKTFRPSDFVADPRNYGGRTKWIVPRWDWIDPLKDLSAEKLAVDSGFKSRSCVIEEMGYDAAEVDDEISKDQERAESLGLKFVQVSTGIVVAPSAEDDANPPLDPNPPGGEYPENSPTPKGPRQKPQARRKPPTKFSWDR